MAHIAALLRRVGGLDRRDAALVYARAGLAVFPCAPGQKRPLTWHGFKNATTNAAQVRAWWQLWPEANIGVATGGAGVDVLDIDVRESGSGFAAFNRARRAGLTGSWVTLVRTPSGGLHAYYPADPARPQVSWHLRDMHIDFCGRGGYVIAPPSQLAMGTGACRYEVITTGRHPDRLDAEAIRQLLTPPGRASGATSRDAQAADPSGGRLAAWVAVQPEGNRNLALFWAACRFAEAGLPERAATESLAPAAKQSGLGGREIGATIRSAYRVAQLPQPAHAAASPEPDKRGVSR